MTEQERIEWADGVAQTCTAVLQDDRDLGEILFSVEVREVVPDERSDAVETLLP